MNFLESFRVAWTALATNKLRALLTMLGIIIGVGAVVGMLAIGNGYAAFIQSEFNKLGVGIFYINPTVDSRETDAQIRPRLTATDAEAILRPGAAPAVESVAVEFESDGVVSAGGERYIFGVKGVTTSYFTITTNDLGPGRFFGAAEEQSAARVAVIGNKVAQTLYGDIGAAVGQRLNINGVGFEVVGVTVTQQNRLGGAIGRFGDPGEQILLPYKTARDRLFRNEVNSRVDVSNITVRARSVAEVDEAIRQVTAVLRQEHRLTYQANDFRISNPEEAARQFAAVTSGFSAFLGVIGGISLLVGGIGIMNIMLVSVAQRTREIGLRKAVGARRRDIMWQFLIEALVLCLVGGGIGIAFGFGLAQLGNLLFTQVFQIEDARSTVTFNSLVLATGISAAIGIFFGLFPAMRAARLDPIRALRNE